MNIPLIIVIGYMVFMIGVSFAVGRISKPKDSTKFLLAGQNLPWYLVAVMVTGIAVGGASTVGVAETAYTSGISASWYTIAWTCAALVFAMLLSNKVRKYNLSTVSELIGRVFGKTDGFVAIIFQVVLMFSINATQIVAGGAILAALLPNMFTLTSGMIVSTIVFVLTAFLGGYMGACVTNLMNVIIIYVGIVLSVIYSLNAIGGMDTLFTSSNVPVTSFSAIEGVGAAAVLAWIVTMCMTAPPNQMLFQVSAAAKNEKHGKRGFLVAAILIAPTGILSALIGIIAAHQFPNLESATMALPTLAMSLPAVLAGLVLAGLWAADISTATGLMLGISTIITKDIVKAHLVKDIGEKQQIGLSKIIMVISAVMGLLVAMNVGSILSFLLQFMALYSPYALVILAILYCPGILKKSTCRATIYMGFAVMLVWIFVPQTHVLGSVIYAIVPLCAVTMAICYSVDKRPFQGRLSK